MSIPTSVRLLSAGLGALVAYLNLRPAASMLFAEPIEAIGHLVVGVPLVVLFAWVAAWPKEADRIFRERWGIDLSDTGTVAGVLLHVVFVYLVFAGTLLATTQGLSQLVETGQHPADTGALTGESVVYNLVLNLFLFAVAAVTWILLVDKERGEDVLAVLRLEPSGIPRGIVGGVLMTVAGIVVLAVLGFVLQQLGHTPENPQAQAIAKALTPATAVAVAALAGLGEEIYFRGFLLPKTGNLAQAALFGALHATYLTPFQVILPFALGLAFGWLTRKTGLWGPIVAHTTFNAVMLLSAIYAGEMPGGTALRWF